jgi:hypothetical protein
VTDTKQDALRTALEYGERWMRHVIEETEWADTDESSREHKKAKAELAHVRSVIEALSAQPEQPVAWKPTLAQLCKAIDLFEAAQNDARPEGGMHQAFDYLLKLMPASPQVRAEPVKPKYDYDKTMRALLAATEGNDGMLRLSPRKFWGTYSGEQVRAEQAAVPDYRNSVNYRIGEGVQRAAGELPELYELRIDLECGAGVVQLHDPDGELIGDEWNGDDFADQIHNAINSAIAHAEKAQPPQESKT